LSNYAIVNYLFIQFGTIDISQSIKRQKAAFLTSGLELMLAPKGVSLCNRLRSHFTECSAQCNVSVYQEEIT